MPVSLADFDDRLNPFLVKEARQLVRSKAVVGGQWLLLLALMALLVAGAFDASADGDGEQATGLKAFRLIHRAWGVVCLYGIPLYVGVRMACECTHPEGLDMLRGMTVSATRMVLGKWMSGLLLGVLALSLFAPFLTLCYFLRGVGLDMVLASVWAGCLQLGIGSMLALYVGCNGKGWAIKVAMALVYLLFSACLAGASSVAVLPSSVSSAWSMGERMAVMTGIAFFIGMVAVGLAVSSLKILLADAYARKYALERRAAVLGRNLGAGLRGMVIGHSAGDAGGKGRA